MSRKHDKWLTYCLKSFPCRLSIVEKFFFAKELFVNEHKWACSFSILSSDKVDSKCFRRCFVRPKGIKCKKYYRNISLKNHEVCEYNNNEIQCIHIHVNSETYLIAKHLETNFMSQFVGLP